MKHRAHICLLVAALCLVLPVSSASAIVKLDGFFIATQTCDAFQSKKNKSNPGDVRLTPRFAYDMIGINKQAGDFFQIDVPGAPVTQSRWVPVTCGIHVVRSSVQVAGATATAPIEPQQGKESTDNLLALSWQPGFCELKPDKTECRNLNNGLLPVAEAQLSIHGLWAQPRGKDYCNVPASLQQIDQSKRWDRLPRLPLSADVREKLNVLMPGTASYLHRHEWIKHGTCHLGEGARPPISPSLIVGIKLPSALEYFQGLACIT